MYMYVYTSSIEVRYTITHIQGSNNNCLCSAVVRMYVSKLPISVEKGGLKYT